ncbi:hypothetical protein DERP_008416 [Dermatophagoides pteronyssinus]|uniref:Uncharacterized protein n=1 Tax=Dermatophagoides pteronyssinus TaxID=6956 RepID=A0ABQ8IVJ8_DERPT|nr:hypothetical protein DERP_008416 [Dermatophagoides pteronyssinus]
MFIWTIVDNEKINVSSSTWSVSSVDISPSVTGWKEKRRKNIVSETFPTKNLKIPKKKLVPVHKYRDQIR